MRAARFISLLLVMLAVLPVGLAPSPAAAAEEDAEFADLPTEVTALYFPLTSHNLVGGFLRHWWQQGQVLVYGFPISEELNEGGRTVQYFERARFEYHPEHKGTPYEIQLTQLGRRLANGRSDGPFAPYEPVSESPERDYFEATGHTVAYAFKKFWESRGGLANFGYPLSEEFVEDGRTVQYFERARFEHFPEARDTIYEVQLTLLGRRALAGAERAAAPAARLTESTEWTPTLAEEIAQRLRAERERTWLAAQPSPVDRFQAVVTVGVAEVRAAPTTVATRYRYTYARHIVHVVGAANGEPIGGSTRWYQLSSGGYIPSAHVGAFWPPAPPRTWPGRWVDVNLSSFYITAYAGSTPLYSAIITAGRDNRTPLGVFSIGRRVRSETMDSATVGIPKGHPEYYYLENVEFTQYITGLGHALHGNYWVHPSRYGRFSSNGCVGMMNADAAYFWEFAGSGTPVHIHF